MKSKNVREMTLGTASTLIMFEMLSGLEPKSNRDYMFMTQPICMCRVTEGIGFQIKWQSLPCTVSEVQTILSELFLHIIVPTKMPGIETIFQRLLTRCKLI